jgi:heptosyltransferase-2
MSSASLPPPGAVKRILVWHRGALGDLLLAGPALMALSRHYWRARLVGVGDAGRWGLLSGTLPLEAVWSGDEGAWAWLFQEDAPLPRALKERLAPFDLALVFSPGPPAVLLARLGQAGIPAVHWIPSFPRGGGEAVGACQARHLAGLGLSLASLPLRLVGKGNSGRDDAPELPGPGPWVAVAPGSGALAKNWPLAHYYAFTRALAWQERLKIVWLAGPAEAAMLPFLSGLAGAQDQVLLSGLPLVRVAAVLSRGRLFVGGDSGLTHLAAAVGTPVLALFGPTDPRIWAPPGEAVRVLAGPCPQAPCARGREIPCPTPRCLADLSPETVLRAAAHLISRRWPEDGPPRAGAGIPPG